MVADLDGARVARAGPTGRSSFEADRFVPQGLPVTALAGTADAVGHCAFWQSRVIGDLARGLTGLPASEEFIIAGADSLGACGRAGLLDLPGVFEPVPLYSLCQGHVVAGAGPCNGTCHPAAGHPVCPCGDGLRRTGDTWALRGNRSQPVRYVGPETTPSWGA